MTARNRGRGRRRVWQAYARERARELWTRHATTSRWLAFTGVSFVALGTAGLVGGVVLWAVHLYWSPRPEVVAMGAGLTLALAGLAWLAAGVPEPVSIYEVTQRDVPSLLAVIGVLGLVVAAGRGTTATSAAGDIEDPVRRAGHLLQPLLIPVRRDRPTGPALLEATAVLAAVVSQTLPSATTSLGVVDRWVADALWFAVPALVAAAGHRAARQGPTPGRTRRRLERLLVPYLLVSVVALGLRSWSPGFPPPGNPGVDLLLGATFAPYHLVLTLVVLALATPALLRLRGRAAVAVLVVAVISQTVVQTLVGTTFWRLRNPLLWLAFYVAGMLAWRHRDGLGRWSTAWPAVLLSWSLAVTVVLVLPDDTPARDLATLAAAWLLVAALWLLGRTLTLLPRAVWGVARSAYPLYLLHVPFVIVVTGAAGTPAPSVRSAAGWSIGLIGALSAIVIGRHVLGAASQPAPGD